MGSVGGGRVASRVKADWDAARTMDVGLGSRRARRMTMKSD